MDADFRKVAWAVGDGLKEFAGSAEYHGQGRTIAVGEISRKRRKN
jgi:hypothetical protein